MRIALIRTSCRTHKQLEQMYHLFIKCTIFSFFKFYRRVIHIIVFLSFVEESPVACKKKCVESKSEALDTNDKTSEYI